MCFGPWKTRRPVPNSQDSKALQAAKTAGDLRSAENIVTGHRAFPKHSGVLSGFYSH